jgi:hypothetical protein
MGRIPLSEVSDTPPPLISPSLKLQVQAQAARRIDDILGDPRGLPNGKGKRTKLTLTDRDELKSALMNAVGHAAVWASNKPLPNRVRGPGRPPDNSVFIFIEDLAHAFEVVGLKPGLRYIEPVSALVGLFIELSPLLWGPVKDPRRYFQRWQRLRHDLRRE